MEFPDQSAILTTSSKGTPLDLAFEVEADRVQYPLNMLVSIPALDKTNLIQQEIKHEQKNTEVTSQEILIKPGN